MIFNPIYNLSSMIIRYIVKKVNLPIIFKSIAINLFNVSRHLIRTEGIIPTLSVLHSVNREIRNNGTLNSIVLNRRLNPAVSNAICNILFSNWGDCLAFSSVINKNFKWYLMGIVFSSFTTIFYYITRISIGAVISSLGILYSESLSSVSYLKSFSDYILELIEKHSNFRFLP